MTRWESSVPAEGEETRRRGSIPNGVTSRNPNSVLASGPAFHEPHSHSAHPSQLLDDQARTSSPWVVRTDGARIRWKTRSGKACQALTPA
jgi:hypothetical protein